MKYNFVIFSLLTLTTGCATALSGAARNVRDADDNMVKECEFISLFTGTSGHGGLNQSTGINNAKNEILEDAAAKGATHIVWTNISGGWAPSAAAKGYKCPQSKRN